MLEYMVIGHVIGLGPTAVLRAMVSCYMDFLPFSFYVDLQNLPRLIYDDVEAQEM